ncbi:MAG: tyrosine-type recombinase/integrase [Bacteroidota bacterium]
MNFRSYPDLRAKTTASGATWYYADFYDPARTPKRKWWTLRTTDRRLAERRLAKIGEAYVNQQFDPWTEQRVAPGLAVSDAAEQYLVASQKRGLKSSTLGPKRRLLIRLTDALPPGYALQDVRPRDIERFLDRAPQGGVGSAGEARIRPQSRNTYRTQLVAFFSWCIETKLLDGDNPARAVKRAKVADAPIQYFTLDDLAAVKRTMDAREVLRPQSQRTRYRAPSVWLWPYVQLVMYAGLRLQEAQRLRWGDIEADFEHPERGGLLHVRNVPPSTYQKGGTTKFGKERAVPLVSPAVEVLRGRHADRATEDPEEPVFLRAARTGGPKAISLTSASQLWRELRREAGISPFPLRKLRASTGTLLASKGVAMKMVQQVYGHSSIELTARVYAGAYLDDVRAQMEAAFQSASEKV